jgi:uncharacterized protein YkwD
MKFFRNLTVMMAAVGIFAAVLPVTNAAASSRSWSCYRFSSAEHAFAKKTNKARTAHGLSKVSLDPQLSKSATKHNRSMVRKRLLFHTSNSQFYNWVTHWSMLGENVGEGGGVKSLQHAFMHSPEHRANILENSFKHIGIAVKKKNGVMWVTVQFESSNDPGTTLTAPSC